MISFKAFITEETTFNEKQALKDAMSWLENKYGKDLYTFKNIPGMDMQGEKTKVYDIVVGDNHYILNLKKFDSNSDGTLDSVGFDVLPAVAPDEDEDEL